MPLPDAVREMRPRWDWRSPRMMRAGFVLLCCAGLMALVGWLYRPTLEYPFHFDDYPYLVSNPLYKDVRNFGYFRDFRSFATQDAGRALDKDLVVNFMLRPVGYFSFYLNAWAGAGDPGGFRAVNIAIHAGNAALVFLLVLRLLSVAPGRARPGAASLRFIPVATALLFAVHPLHTESVTYVVQRFTSLATFFYLLALLLAVLSWSARAGWRKGVLLGLSVLFTVAGMLTKESVFTLPVMLVLLDRVVMRTPWRAALRRAWPLLLCLPLIPALVMLTHWARHGGGADVGGALNLVNYEGGQDYQLRYALTQPRIVMEYLRLIFAPLGLNVDPSVPLAASWTEAQVWAPLLALGILMGWALWMGHRWREDVRARFACAAVLWFFMGLAVTSSFIPLPDVMAEHRTYRPCIGMLGAVACLADVLRTRLPRRMSFAWVMPVAVAFCAVQLGALTVERNRVWSSAESLWEDAVLKSPDKARPRCNLAVYRAARGKLDDAAGLLEEAIRLAPDEEVAYANLGTIRNNQKRHHEALEASTAGLKQNPGPGVARELHFNSGVALCCLGRVEEGLKEFQRTLEVDPEHFLAHATLAQMALNRGDRADALAHLRRAHEVQPAHQGVNDALKQLGEQP